MSPARRLVWAAGRAVDGGAAAGTVTGCLLSSSDTQYKMTISMAVWPSESSEVSQGRGQAPGCPSLGGKQVGAEVCRLCGTLQRGVPPSFPSHPAYFHPCPPSTVLGTQQ